MHLQLLSVGQIIPDEFKSKDNNAAASLNVALTPHVCMRTSGKSCVGAERKLDPLLWTTARYSMPTIVPFD
jgi:hypothetical protein